MAYGARGRSKSQKCGSLKRGGIRGAAAGRATFSPLTVDISSLVGLAPLLADEVSGRSIKSVELIGVTNEGNQAVYDLKLSTAVALMVQTTAGLHGIDATVAFDFQKVSLTDHGVTSGVRLGCRKQLASTRSINSSNNEVLFGVTGVISFS